MTQHSAATAKRHMIHFSGSITPVSVNNIKGTTLQALTSHQSNPAMPPVSELYYIFASEGGDVNSGIYLYNFLRGIGMPITMHNFASVESVATMVFMAADKRYIVPSGRFIFHSFSRNFPFASVDAPRLQEAAASIDSYMDIYTSCLKERIDDTKEPIDFESIFKGEAHIMDATSAVATGIVHKIVSPDGLMNPNDVHWLVAP